MRVTIFIFLVTILQARAVTSVAQKITIKENNISLKAVFDNIKTQGGFDIFYSSTLIDPNSKVNLNIEQGDVEDVLNSALANLPLTYSINEKVIVITRRKILPAIVAADTLVSGHVIDAKTKQAIPGATISIKLKKIVTVTNIQGNFSIKANVGDSLLVSFVGFVSKSVSVKNLRNRLLIVLEETISNLNEVTVNGIFERKKDTYTGTTRTITQEQLLSAGTTNILQSVANLDPSFAIIQNNAAGSNPNVLPQIQIHGQNGFPATPVASATPTSSLASSTTDPNQPLFILDGFETTLQTVANLDPYRVASITLLQDAASRAIYGIKAANGVMVIETVRPKAGQLQLSYNLTAGFSAPDLSSYHLANASQKLQAEVNAGIYKSGTTPLLTQYNSYLENVLRGVNTDWLAKPLQNGLLQNHSFYVSGGDTHLLYGVTLNYSSNNGVMKGSANNTLGGQIYLAYRVKGLNISNQLTVNSNNATNSPWGNFSSYAAMNPYLPYTDANGNLLKQINTALEIPGGSVNTASTPIYNPAYNSTLGSFDKSNYTQITNNTAIDWNINNKFRVRGTFSATTQTSGTDTYKAADDTYFTSPVYSSGTGIYRKGYYVQGNALSNSYGSISTLNYTDKIGKNTVAVNAGYNLQSNTSRSSSYTVEGFPNPLLSLPSNGLQYMLNTVPSGTEATVRTLGLVSSASYAYDEKYLFDGTYTMTENSSNGADHRWAPIWAIGVGWNMQYENFIKDLKFIDQLKLTVTKGVTGSVGFSPYQSIGTYSYYLNSNYQNATGAYLLSLANPDLQMQTQHDNHYTVNFSFLKKLSGSFAYYVTNTDGLLTSITLPPSTGFSSYIANLGKVQNTGFDSYLTYRVLNNPKDRSYFNIFVNVSHNRNVLKQISSSLQSYNATTIASLSNSSTSILGAGTTSANTAVVNKPKVLYYEGQSMNAIYAVRSLGIDPATGKELYRKLDGSVTNVWSANDLTIVGDALPKYNTDFGFSFAKSGFTVNLTFNYIFGGQMYNQTLVDKVENANIYNNVDVRVLTQRWTKPGDIVAFKNIADQTQTQVTSRFVQNNNTLTMTNAQLGYDLARLKKIRKMGFSLLQLTLQSSSVFVVSSIEQERGTSYPYARAIDLVLRANF